MSNIPSLTSKKLLKILISKGFEIDHSTGSHYILYNKNSKKRITFPYHSKDLPKGTMFAIIKSAGLSIKDLIE